MLSLSWWCLQSNTPAYMYDKWKGLITYLSFYRENPPMLMDIPFRNAQTTCMQFIGELKETIINFEAGINMYNVQNFHL